MYIYIICVKSTNWMMLFFIILFLEMCSANYDLCVRTLNIYLGGRGDYDNYYNNYIT